MRAEVETYHGQWLVTILDDDGYRQPELTEIYPTERQADARADEINGDEDEDAE